jgi:hypothetical protein
MDRRQVNKHMLQLLSGFLLVDTALGTKSLSAAVKPIITDWATELNTYCLDLYSDRISQQIWQQQVAQLFNHIPLSDIVAYIDFEKLKKGIELPDLGVNARTIPFPEIDELPKTVYFQKIFGLKKDRAIIPHGHSNMVSSHVVLQGDFHLRHYDKINQEGEFLTIQPSQERIIHAGDHSSISDSTDNIHWFIAKSHAAYTFDVILINLNEEAYDIHNLDMDTATDIGNGHLRVKEMDVETALKKYGKLHH